MQRPGGSNFGSLLGSRPLRAESDFSKGLRFKPTNRLRTSVSKNGAWERTVPFDLTRWLSRPYSGQAGRRVDFSRPTAVAADGDGIDPKDSFRLIFSAIWASKAIPFSIFRVRTQTQRFSEFSSPCRLFCRLWLSLKGRHSEFRLKPRATRGIGDDLGMIRGSKEMGAAAQAEDFRG